MDQALTLKFISSASYCLYSFEMQRNTAASCEELGSVDFEIFTPLQISWSLKQKLTDYTSSAIIVSSYNAPRIYG